MQDVVHQRAQEALCLVALRETASHVLNYGMWVAMTHLKSYIDIPAVATCCNRIYQALQLACDLAIGQLDTQLSTGQKRVQQYTRDDSVYVSANAERLKAVQKSIRARVDNSQCMMWGSLCDEIKSATCQRTCSGSQSSLVVVDAAALEMAFQIVSAAGLKIQLLQADLNTTKVRPPPS